MKILFSRFVTDKSGVTAIEYGLIVVAVIIIGAVATVGTSLQNTFNSVSRCTLGNGALRMTWWKARPKRPGLYTLGSAFQFCHQRPMSGAMRRSS